MAMCDYYRTAGVVLYLLVTLATFRILRGRARAYNRHSIPLFKPLATALLWPWLLLWAPIWRFGRWLAIESE